MNANALVWDGGPGHYEVYYLTTTDPVSGTGLWIRYTMRAPLSGPSECHLWFLAMKADGTRFGHKQTFGIDQMVAEADPFRLRIADCILEDHAMSGHLDTVAWDLSWTSHLKSYDVVHPFFKKTGMAKTIFGVPHPDVTV